MDNPPFMERITAHAAALDYRVIHNMLQACVDFKYTNSHIFSDELIRVIIVELEYWHNLAERLLKEKVNNE